MGRFDDATDGLAAVEGSVTNDFVGRGELLAARAEVALWSGRPRRAIDLAMAVLGVPSPIVNAYVLPELTRAWAQLELGVRPEPPIDIAATPISAGARPEGEGLVLLHAGLADAAAGCFADAAVRWSSFDRPRSLLCRWAEGEALRLAGRESAAKERLQFVLDEAMAMGHAVIELRARRSLRRAGVRTAGHARPRASSGLRLTDRERELVGLVGRGLTNIEIARRMGLGRPTVSRTLSNAMAKLGAESRAQAVVLAADLD
jgi:DNA-binding CsgD family transcriptional regulator